MRILVQKFGGTSVATAENRKLAVEKISRAIADYLTQCPYQVGAEGPLFVGAKGGELSPRIIQLAMEGLRGALGLPDFGLAEYSYGQQRRIGLALIGRF